MLVLIKEAWYGWLSFQSEGKLTALLLISLFLLWFYYDKAKKSTLIIYSTVMTVLCICPVTAACIMWYQTRFYDYRWVFSMIPLTVIIGLGITVFITYILKEYVKENKAKSLLLVVALILILCMCGGMGKSPWNIKTDKMQRAYAQDILSKVGNLAGEREIVLWAPEEILEYAREYDSSIRIPYGRNMWDISLNAYCYDTYPEEIVNLYHWIEGEQKDILSFWDCMDTVKQTGINCILLPNNLTTDQIRSIERMLGTAAEPMERYYLWIL